MTLPEELQPLIHEPPLAAARVSSGLDGPVGEIWLVATGDGLRAFTRESMFRDFTELELDPEHPPNLEEGTFADTLFLAVAGGTGHEVSVSSFERKDVRGVLTAAPAPVEHTPETPPAPPEPEHPPVLDFTPEGEQPFPTPEPEPMPSPVYAGDERKPTFENSGQSNAEDERRIQQLLMRDDYYGMTFSAGGCIAMLAGLAVPIVLLWMLNETLTLDTIARHWGADAASETWLYVGRAVAVVLGLIIGVRVVRVVVRTMQKAGKLGSVVFNRHTLQVSGIRGQWRETFELNKPFSLTFVFQPQNKEAQMLTPAMVLEQGGATVTLRTFGDAFVQVGDTRVTWHERPAPPEGTKMLVLEKRVFAAIARRLLSYTERAA
jgi:hypothetical protein